MNALDFGSPPLADQRTYAPLVVNGSMMSDVGLARKNNEDKVTFIVPGPRLPEYARGSLLLVADGMGGHAAGEVASQIAADTIRQGFYFLDGAVPDILRTCFEDANTAIRHRVQSDPACAGMGTTCTVIAVQDGKAYLGHIGDSRAYLRRNGTMHQISPDHTMVAQLVRDGALTQEEADQHPDRHVLIKALGTKALIDPFVWDEGLPLLEGDRILLCSDGLSDFVPGPEIEQIVAAHPPADACDALITAALLAGGYDNVSVGVFVIDRYTESGDRPVQPTRRVDETPDLDSPA